MTLLLKVLMAFALVLATVTAAYLKGRTDGAEKVEDRWEAERLVFAQEFQKQVAATETIEAERDRALEEIARELRPKLAAADASVAGLARRLRDLQRPRDCPVSSDPAPPAGDSSTGGVSDLPLAAERALDELLGAAARDSARLTACQAAYERVRGAMVQ